MNNRRCSKRYILLDITAIAFVFSFAGALDCQLRRSWQSPITDADLRGVSSTIIDFKFQGSKCNDIFGGTEPVINYTINTYSADGSTSLNIDEYITVSYPQIIVNVPDNELA